ncbi:hypothetical protein AURDEDRAFT_128817 [Auricularia subglabra TFB-10046 SS5]|nr:hypothetical protein AURDEDRAFT_128817 [Auricularia subglabra TFB-10046 SS5]
MAFISEQCRHALQSAVSAACLEMEQSSLAPEDIWKLVLGEIYPVIQTHACRWTERRSAASRLPNELLVEIFSHLGLRDRMRTATVSHKWRDVSLGAIGRLWAVIPYIGNRELWSFLLKRSRNVPVTLGLIRLLPSAIQDVADMLEEHISHIKVLDIELPMFIDPAKTRPLIHLLEPAFQTPSPALRSISLIDEHELYLDESRGLPILQSPGLQRIVLHGMDLSCLTPLAGSLALRTLFVKTPDRNDGFTAEYFPLLCSFPALETLILEIPRASDTITFGAAVLPLTLRRLHLQMAGRVFSRNVASFNISRIPICTISFLNQDEKYPSPAAVHALLHDFVATTGAVNFRDAVIDVLLVDANGRQRVVQAVRMDSTWHRWLSQVDTLCINGLDRIPEHILTTLVDFPTLRTLTLDVTPSPAQIMRDGGSRITTWPRIGCPQLRELHIRSAEARAQAQMDTSTVETLLTRHLHLGQRQLSLLAFDRIHFLRSHQPTVDSLGLRPLAETVMMENHEDPWPLCPFVWNKLFDY